MQVEAYLDVEAQNAIERALGAPAPAVVRASADPKFGDYQVNGVLPLAKAMKKPPREIAEAVAVELKKCDAIDTVEVAGPGFINLRLKSDWMAAELTRSLHDKTRTGVPVVERAETIVVDFSSPNIAKQMHVGHLRSTIIGAAIIELLRFTGHRVIGDNHLGDWGTQFGLLILGMRLFSSKEQLEADPIGELERIYKLAAARAKEDPAAADEARSELAKLQTGDAENLALWKTFVAVTRKELDKIYARLGVTFDTWLGESAYHDALPGIVDTLLSRGIAREDQGAVCVFFENLEAAPADLRKVKEPFIVRKKDGAFLYSTTDIATALHRKEHFRADRSVYVVDVRQSLHFKQLFAVLDMMGAQLKTDHVGFGTILGDDGKPLKTRDGTPVTLSSLLDESELRAKARIREEGLEVSEEELAQVSHAVGIGAVKYADLRQNRVSDYQFDWDKLISFKGNSGPYLQYAYARVRSLFRKGEVDFAAFSKTAEVGLHTPEERLLARQLLRFADIVHMAAATYQPHLICDHLYELARLFSSFYEACPVLKADEPTRSERLGLSAIVAAQLGQGLKLLGIEAIERM